MVHRRTALALCTALILSGAGLALAEPNPKLVDFLKTRPSDKVKVVGLLKKYLVAQDFDDAYLVARYVVKQLGDRSARLYEILALCATRVNDLDRARSYANEALRIDPTSARARRIIATLEPAKGAAPELTKAGPENTARGFIASSPAPAPSPAAPAEIAGRVAPVTDAKPAASSGPEAPAAAPVTSPAAASFTAPAALPDDAPLLASIRTVPLGKLEEAKRSYWEDRFDKALHAVNDALAKTPRDKDALMLKAKIQAARMEYKDAATILKDLASRESARDPEVYLALANLARDLAGVTNQESELRTAHDQFKNALKLGPDHVGTLLGYASFLFQLNQPEQAEQLYQRARTHQPFRGREQQLDHAQILFFRNQPKEALEVLQAYTRMYGSDSQSLRLEGMVLLRLDKREEAGESFELAFMRNPSNLPMIMTIVPVLVTMDQAERALKVISAAEAKHPDSKAVSDLKAQIKMRVMTDRELVKVQRGPFVFTYPKALETREDRALQAIEAAFDQAFRHVNRVMNFTPNEVKVRISMVTGIDNPAYYSPDTDTITIGATWFCREKGEPAYEAAARREHSAHMVRHEYAHLVFAHRLSVEDYRAVNATIPLWLLEGVAEWAAGGCSTLTGSPVKVKQLFRDGYLDYAAMERNMQVINGSKDPDLNHKSYLQSYFIVKYMIARTGSDLKNGLDTFFAFNQELVSGTGKFEAALQKVYNISLDQFRRGWVGQIESDVVRRAQPDLTSFVMPPADSEPDTAVAASAVSEPATR